MRFRTLLLAVLIGVCSLQVVQAQQYSQAFRQQKPKKYKAKKYKPKKYKAKKFKGGKYKAPKQKKAKWGR